MRFGELMLRAPALDIKPAKLWDLFHDPGEGLRAVGHALLGWAVAIIPAGILLTLALTPTFAFLKRKCAPAVSERVAQRWLWAARVAHGTGWVRGGQQARWALLMEGCTASGWLVPAQQTPDRRAGTQVRPSPGGHARWQCL